MRIACALFVGIGYGGVPLSRPPQVITVIDERNKYRCCVWEGAPAH